MPALSDLRPGDRAVVLTVTGEPAVVQRLYEFGLLEGDAVELIGVAPLGDPIEILLGNTRLTLRKAEAHGVGVRLTSGTAG